MAARPTVSRSDLVEAVAGHTGQPRRVVDVVLDGLVDVIAASLALDKRVVIRGVLSAQRGPTGLVMSPGKNLAAVAGGNRPAPQIRTGLADARERARLAAQAQKRRLAG